MHLPSLQDLYYSRVKKRAGNIITDPSHPGHDLFALLPSGRRYRSLCTRTSRHKNIFFPLCHLQPKQLTQELLPVFCNSLTLILACNSSPISNYLLSLVLCKYVCIIFYTAVYKKRGKGSGVWPSMVTHTRNLSSAFNPSKCTLTAVNTHLEQWAAILRRPGSSLGDRCLAQGSHLSCGIEGGESTCYSLPPPTIPAGPGNRTGNLWVTSPTL